MQLHHFSGLLISLADPILSHADTADTDTKITKILLTVPVADRCCLSQSLLHSRCPAVSGKIKKTAKNPCAKIDHFRKFTFCPKKLLRTFQQSVTEMMGILFHFQRRPLSFPLCPVLHKHTDHSTVKIFPGDSGFHTLFLTCLIFQYPRDQSVKKIILQSVTSQMNQLSRPCLFLTFFSALLDQPG